MSETTLILVALALAMDAFAVSVSSGIAIRRMHIRHAMRIAGFFGTFQAAMPVLGWWSGHSARRIIGRVDHWVAFGLLTLIGVKMILEALRPIEERRIANPLNVYVLFTLAFATSIDAFAVGVALAALSFPIVHPALVIGAITFVTSFGGAYIGDYFGHLFERKLEVVGGLLLIGIGVRILLGHLL